MFWMKKPSLSHLFTTEQAVNRFLLLECSPSVGQLSCLVNPDMESKSAQEAVAKLSYNSTEGVRLGCTICGFPGHFRYQCRNFQQINPNQDVILDVSSTSSDSDEDEELLMELVKKESTDKSR